MLIVDREARMISTPRIIMLVMTTSDDDLMRRTVRMTKRVIVCSDDMKKEKQVCFDDLMMPTMTGDSRGGRAEG